VSIGQASEQGRIITVEGNLKVQQGDIGYRKPRAGATAAAVL